MLLSAFVLLTGCTLAFAGGYADSKGCCEYKHVPGSMPKSGDYFLLEHRDGMIPDFCKDGCVYRKENSGPNKEYCFKRSWTYSAECQDKAEGGEQAVEIPDYGSDTTTASTVGHNDHEEGNCDFTDIVDVDGQHYTTAGIRTNEDGILKFEFDKNVPLEVSLVEEPSITFNCINEICTSNDPVDAGTWTISVKNTFPEDDPWDVPPLIKTYFVDDKNYCEGCSHTMSAAGGQV